jgi:hypothetical protein
MSSIETIDRRRSVVVSTGKDRLIYQTFMYSELSRGLVCEIRATW